jgi:uncharacterized protein (TIGR03437 family)
LYRIDGAGGSVKIYSTGAAVIVGAAFSPCDSHTVFTASAHAVLRSQDLGTTWTSSALPDGITPNNIAVACDQPSAPAVYISAREGLIRTRDLVHWDTLISTGGSAYRVWVDPNVQTTLYARGDGGLSRSVDGGSHWQLTGVTTGDLTFDAARPGTIFAPLVQFSDGSTIAISAIVPAKSSDFGKTWTPLAALPGRDTFPQVVVPDPVRLNVLYALGSGLFVSTDAGQTWAVKQTPVGPPLAVDGDTIYAVSVSGVVSTRDGFDTLTRLTSALPYVTSLVAAGGVAFASTTSTHDVFVAKLSPDGDVLFSTYFGGSHDETPRAIAVGADGGVYVTGTTASLDFPTTNAAFQPGARNQGAKFLFKLNADGTLAYSTYFAGDYDYNTSASALAVDAQGSAIVAGTTSGGIPTTAGSYQPGFNGVSVGGAGSLIPLPPATNAYVAKFQPDGSGLVYSTYLGSQSDSANAMALAPDGSVYVGGGNHMFHLSGDGSRLLETASTGGQPVASMVLNGTGEVFIVGAAPPNGTQTLRRLTGDLHFGSAEYLAGVTSAALSFDTAGNLLVAGAATPLLPTVAPLQGPFAPVTGFVSAMAPDLSSTLFSTFSGDRHLFSVANAVASPDGAIVFGGSTQRSYPQGVFYPFPPGPNDAGSSDVYVAKLLPQLPALRIDSIANAASFIADPLSANETVIIRGWGFGDDVQVLLDDATIAVLSHTVGTIMATVPDGFPADVASRVQVQSGGVRSNAIAMPVSAASPGLFSVDRSGLGQGYILNPDGTQNSPSNPVAEGDPITIYVTGGALGVPVSVTVDGFVAKGTGVSSGRIDGLPGAVYKVSAIVPRPSDMADQNPILKGFKMPPTVPVQVTMGVVKSQNGITLSVK